MPIEEHDYHIKLENDAILSRYMSLDKYESMLREKALFFCRADKFIDPFEGSVPKRESAWRRERGENYAKMKGVEYKGSLHESSVEGLSDLHKMRTSATVVNCWHINNNESDAMWNLYLKDNEGVAIQSSKAGIYRALENTSQKIGMTKIRYLDYINGIWHHPVDFPHEGYNLITPFIHKRVEFEHEKELRLYRTIVEAERNPDYWDKQKYHKGELINVDIKLLVEKVIFAPTADDNAKKKITELTKNYGFNFHFENSVLKSDPYY